MTTIRSNRKSGMMRIENSQLLLPSTLRETDIAVTRLRCENGWHGPTAPYDLEDSFLLTMQLSHFEFGLDCRGQQLPDCRNPYSTAAIYEMDRTWIADMRSPFDAMHFHFPRAALDKLALDLGTKPIVSIRCPPQDGKRDEVLFHLSQSLLPSLERPHELNRLFVDHVRLAIGAHVARVYGSTNVSATVKGGLSPRHIRLLTEKIDANLDGNLSACELAQDCGLSTGHLHRAFRRTTGTTLHRWLVQRRIERVKALLLGSGLGLAEIAVVCGFADQSHMTKSFSRCVGVTPHSWRRARDN